MKFCIKIALKSSLSIYVSSGWGLDIYRKGKNNRNDNDVDERGRGVVLPAPAGHDDGDGDGDERGRGRGVVLPDHDDDMIVRFPSTWGVTPAGVQLFD